MLLIPVRTPNSLKIYVRLASCCNRQAIEESYSENNPKAIKEKGLLKASQFGFHAMTLHCMRLTDVILNFNKNISTTAVFLDIEKVFDTTWHLGLLYNLLELKFSISLIKLISSFLSKRKFRVSVEDEMSTPRDILAGVPQGSVLSLTLYNIYKLIMMGIKHRSTYRLAFKTLNTLTLASQYILSLMNLW
jgi:hypothetical protein